MYSYIILKRFEVKHYSILFSVVKQQLSDELVSPSSPSKSSERRPAVEFREETIKIENYLNVVSALYNQNWLGFQLDRKQPPTTN